MYKAAYTTNELMSFLDISAASSITRRAERESWQSRPRKGRGGGNEWLVSSMPQATQEAIRKAEERKAIEEEATKSSSLPEALDSRANFATLPAHTRQAVMDDKRRKKAMFKDDLLDLYLTWQRKHGATVAQKDAFILAYKNGAWSELLAALGPKVSWKSLERWKLERKDAGTLLVLADARGLAHRGKSMITERHKGIILGQVLDGDRQISTSVRIIQARCKAEEIAVPSEDTIRRWVKSYSKTCFGDWTLFRQGEKAFNDKCLISILRDWSLVEVGDIVIADGHTLNFESINPETGKPCRMTLLLFLDGASRYPLGWEVMATENVDCISSAFRRACIHLGKFPRVVYLDNGKAFRARFFKGCEDFEQAGFLGLYRDLGCDVIHAWPYHGESKPIERFFGTMHELEELMPSYTGWDIAHKPARLHRNEKLHRALHKKLGRGPLTLEETHQQIADWFAAYSLRPQTRTHLMGKTPNEIFMAGRGPGVDMERLTLMMLQKEIRTISKNGIRLFGRLYWSEELANRRHSVMVRYDMQLSPFTVLVYDPEGNFICEARDRLHYRIAAGIHPAAFALGNESEQQRFTDSVELKKHMAREGKAGFNELLENVIIPETQQRQLATTFKTRPLPEKPVRVLSAEEKAAIEAAKAQARNERESNGYEPSMTMRFVDEPARYDYLFKAMYEKGAELVPEDKAFMAAFETTPQFQRNYKQRYDGLLEVMHSWQNPPAATA